MQETIVEARIEELPALRAAVISDRVAVDDMFTFVPSTIERLIAWVCERGLECSSAVTFLRDPARGIENDSLDVEVGVDVPEGTEGDELVSVRTYPAVRAAVYEHRGPHEGLPAVYEPLRRWIVDHGLEPGEQTREVYPANPSNTTNEQDYVTRVCWPVA